MQISETKLLRMFIEQLTDSLPNNWKVKVKEQSQRSNMQPDFLLRLVAPDGKQVSLVIEAKNSLEPRDIPRVVEQVEAYAKKIKSSQTIIIALYLSPNSRELLVQKGVNYWDTTGNTYLQINKPSLFIRVSGADKNPWPDSRPLLSLKGRAAGRAIRALCDYKPPYGVRELASRSKTSAPSLSRVIDLLIRDAIIERESARGAIVKVDWNTMIRRWAQDYDFVKSNQTSGFLEPRGIKHVLNKLSSSSLQYAVTGSFAAEARGVAVSAPRLITIFISDINAAEQELKLRPAETGVNVLLAEPFDTVVFDRTVKLKSIIYAAPSQVAVDLFTGHGRSPSDGEMLLEWMKKNEHVWRS